MSGASQPVTAALEAEAARLRQSADDTGAGIASGLYPASAGPVAMVHTLLAESLERIVNAILAGPRP